MKKLILCVSIFLGTLAVYAQEKANPVVLEIGNKKVTLEEFEAIYKKNADENKVLSSYHSIVVVNRTALETVISRR